jgi:hypothetical protein
LFAELLSFTVKVMKLALQRCTRLNSVLEDRQHQLQHLLAQVFQDLVVDLRFVKHLAHA